MKEEISSGGKQFWAVIAWSAVLYFICGVISAGFRSYAFVGGIISILIFCVFGFFVLIHYTARFTYTLKGGKLRINRTIGKRNKEIEIKCSDITNLYYGFKPVLFPKRPMSMRVSVFSPKKSLYIEYKNSSGEKNGIIIEPSEKLRRKIDKERKLSDK